MKAFTVRHRLLINIISTASSGLFIMAMAIGMSVVKYGAYHKDGVTALSTIIDKTKVAKPQKDSKYPYNYYINVEFQSDSTSNEVVLAQIKLPGATWKNINIGMQRKIIYLAEIPTKAELKQSVYGDIIMMFIFGMLFVITAVLGTVYREAIVRWLESLRKKKLLRSSR